MSNDFSNLLERLAGADIDFVIVGGFAGVVHGCWFLTQSIEVCCDFSPANLLSLQKALKDIHPVHRMTPNRKKLKLSEKNCKQFKNLYLDTDDGQLDCLSFVDGLGDYRKVKQASQFIRVEDMQLRILSLDALIKAKKAMNRPHDKEAIRQLEAIKKVQKQ